jgi:hypothetical protein
MATARIKNLEQFRRTVGAKSKIAINKMLRDPELRARVGSIVTEDIQKHFKQPASATTQRIRQYLEQYNMTDPRYQRSIINITFTGELMEDLANNVKADTTKLQLVIDHSQKKHSLYITGKGKPKGQRKTHKEISNHVRDLGYDYLQISDNASREILKAIKEKLLQTLAQVLR